MSYDKTKLGLLNETNGFRLWHYSTPDTAATVDTAGYFNAAASVLQVGDVIIAQVDTDGTRATGLMAVVSNAAGVVDVADIVSLTGTDTD